jgi:hypothetical protein
MLDQFEIFKELNKFNNIVFNESDHTYLLNGKKCTSVTQAISSFKKPFDTEIIASRYANKHGLETQDVIDEWDNIRIESTSRGSELHKYAEMRFLSKKYIPEEKASPLCNMFDKFYSDVKDRLIPVKLEFVVGDEEFLVGGMLDKLFYNTTAKALQIWDYKTNKEILRHSKYKNKMLGELSHLQECEFNTYSLQLSIYKLIIERNTNLKLGNSYIVWINDANEKYKVIGTDYMEREAMIILNSLAA